MSNTASTAFFLPMVIGLARKVRMSPGKLLLPLAFAGIVSSSVTLISTSTNVVVSGILKDYRLPPMGMFELAPVGIPIAIVGVLYLLTVGYRLVPDRFSGEDSSGGPLGFRPYLSEIIILPDSPLAGKTLEAAGVGRDLDIRILRILRGKNESLWPGADVVIVPGDVLIVEGASEDILKIKDVPGIEIKADVKLSEPGLSPDELGLLEALILPRSELIGRTLKGYGFRERFGLQVLGISRHGETMLRKLSEIRFQIGDILLLQGHRDRLHTLEQADAVRVVGTPEEVRPRLKLAPVAIAIFVAVIALPTFKLVTLPVAVMLGVVAVFLTRCISSTEAYREVEWKAVILIASMLSLGVAMEQTGAAQYLAAKIVLWTSGVSPLAVLGAFFFLTVLLTQPMSNQAAAIVVLPVAMATAYQLQLNPRTFAMMIAVAASCSYLTPLEPACLMVYGPGRYRFRDFARVGVPLTLLIFAIAIILVPRFWPLR
jgi:di/tricarboxylate transporter